MNERRIDIDIDQDGPEWRRAQRRLRECVEAKVIDMDGPDGGRPVASLTTQELLEGGPVETAGFVAWATDLVVGLLEALAVTGEVAEDDRLVFCREMLRGLERPDTPE
jgi:hypothetical protein